MIPTYQVNQIQHGNEFPILQRENLEVFLKLNKKIIPNELLTKLNYNTSLGLRDEPARITQLNTSLFALAESNALKGDYSLSQAIEKALLHQQQTYQLQNVAPNNAPPYKLNFNKLPPKTPLNLADNGGMVYVQKSIFHISCYSSIWMSKLSAWRNPPANIKQHRIVPILKKAVTEVCLPFLTLTSTIETIAYSALIFGARVLKPLTAKPQDWVTKHYIPELNVSSKFTFFWTAASLVHNIRERVLPLNECQASLRGFNTLTPLSFI